MPSAQPLPLAATGLVLADPSGKDLSSASVLDNTGPTTGWIGILTLSSNADNSEGDDGSQQSLMPNDGATSPGEKDLQTVLSPGQMGPGATSPSDDNSQNPPSQESGKTRIEPNEGSLQLHSGSLLLGSNGLKGDGPLDLGTLGRVHDNGRPKDLIAGSATLASGRLGGGEPVSLGSQDHGLSAGSLSIPGKLLEVQDVLPDGRQLASSRVVADPVPGPVDVHPGVNRLTDPDVTLGMSPTAREDQGFLETVVGPPRAGGIMLQRLGGNEIASAPNLSDGAKVAYPVTAAVPHASLNLSSLGAVERLGNSSAGVGADHGSVGLLPPDSMEREAQSETRELLWGAANRLVEQPSGGAITLANPLPIAEILSDTGRTPSAEFIRRHELSSIAVTGLIREAALLPNLGSRGTGYDQNLANRSSSSAPGIPLPGDGFLFLQTFDSVAGFGLFQYDVASVGPGPSNATLAGSSTASVYLPNEGSSIWSIVTSYALVIVPRQRRYQPTILVVDPDDATRDALSVVLVRAGYYVLPAASVRDAWGHFRMPDARIDLVLMDPHLPDVSGIHLCARLREMSPTLPVMVCAGEVEPAEVAQLQQLGVRYYLRKPIAFEELLHTVKAILA